MEETKITERSYKIIIDLIDNELIGLKIKINSFYGKNALDFNEEDRNKTVKRYRELSIAAHELEKFLDGKII